jgi:hypothetical protein
LQRPTRERLIAHHHIELSVPRLEAEPEHLKLERDAEVEKQAARCMSISNFHHSTLENAVHGPFLISDIFSHGYSFLACERVPHFHHTRCFQDELVRPQSSIHSKQIFGIRPGTLSRRNRKS